MANRARVYPNADVLSAGFAGFNLPAAGISPGGHKVRGHPYRIKRPDARAQIHNVLMAARFKTISAPL
jgi:hypothetical protein